VLTGDTLNERKQHDKWNTNVKKKKKKNISHWWEASLPVGYFQAVREEGLNPGPPDYKSSTLTTCQFCPLCRVKFPFTILKAWKKESWLVGCLAVIVNNIISTRSRNLFDNIFLYFNNVIFFTKKKKAKYDIAKTHWTVRCSSSLSISVS